MSHNQHFSKSSKRRKYLEEVEVVDLFRENPRETPRLLPVETQPSSSTKECQLNMSNVSLSDTTGDSNKCFPSLDLDMNKFESFIEYDSSDSDQDLDFTVFNTDSESILKSLAQWSVNYNITNVALSALLKCLKLHKCFTDFPIDARTVLKTNIPNYSLEIQSVPPGTFYYFGIANGLKSLGNFLHYSDDVIRINIGIDGLPLSKSSGSSFWPILGSIQYYSRVYVFLIGLYWGFEKPKDSNIFLKDMVNELKELSSVGMLTLTGNKIVFVDCISCDAPAKSFITKTKGHSGFYSCSRCNIEGIYIENRVCFPGKKCTPRSHAEFLNRTNEEYHITDVTTILTEIPNIDMVYSFSLDYMHLICLGVGKKLISLWLGNLKKSPLSVRLPSKNVQIISSNLISLRPYICNDFSRYPRGLNELPRWKATEHRLFLLYLGPVVMHGVLNDDCYQHFICLHVSLRILLTPNINLELVNFSEKLLVYFVDKFEKLYGKHFISHNVHGLLHIVDDYKKFGVLDNSSCFPFENYMKCLKKMVRKHEKPLEQVIKRNKEILEFCKPKLIAPPSSNVHIKLLKEHNKGPLINNFPVTQFKIILMNNFKINIASISDCYIGFENEGKLNICKVFNIYKKSKTSKDDVILLVKSFDKIQPYFNKPLNSYKLGICIVDKLSDSFIEINENKTQFQKYMILYSNYGSHHVALPILHTNVNVIVNY